MLGVHAFEALVQEELKRKTPKKQRDPSWEGSPAGSMVCACSQHCQQDTLRRRRSDIHTCCLLVYVGSEYEHTYSVHHDHLKVMWDNDGIEPMKELSLYEHHVKIKNVPELTSVASISQATSTVELEGDKDYVQYRVI